MKVKKRPSYKKEEMDQYFDDPAFRRRKVSKPRKAARAFSVSWTWIMVGVFLALSIIYGIYLFSGLPSLEKIENPRPELATKVYSSDGEVLDQFYVKNRSQVSLREVPQQVIDALVATEDKDFYSHWGVDAFRFVKAMIKNVFLARREGASTITQQLSRNLYLGHDDSNLFDTITRKIREFITAVQLEKNFTKNEIMEFYLNVVYFGRGTYGISAGAQTHFDKTPAELTLSETATLIALLKGPAYYDPVNHPDRAKERRDIVLSQMVKYGYITQEVADAARAEEIEPHPASEAGRTGIAPHFVEYVRQRMQQKAEQYGFDLYRDGLVVQTTIDSRMQRYANQAVEEHLAEYQEMFSGLWKWDKEPDAEKNVIDLAVRTSTGYRRATSAHERDSLYAALSSNEAWVDSVKEAAKRIEVGFVVIDPASGAIKAMVGGANFREFKYGLNHVTQIRRQVGSAFKPLVYTVAIDNGYPPSYELLNQPVTLLMADGKRWTPANSDGTFGGKSTLRNGLRNSINLVAVRAIMEIAPVKEVIEYAHRMGITADLPPYESLALGSGEVSPLEMTSAFGVLANKGVYVEPAGILRIEDKDGDIVEENQPQRREVLSEETSYIMTTMLQDVVDEGTGIRVRSFYHLPAAGKTGTTNEFADAWFIGYTPALVAGVWIGFDNKVVHFTNWDGQGGRAAAPIWAKFMQYVYDDPEIGLPVEYFERPISVFEEIICAETKGLATDYCPSKVVEFFTEKTRPAKCSKHTSLKWNEGEEGMGTISF